jgi:hypothetical protein
VESYARLQEAEIPQLREKWWERCADIMGGVPSRLPPLWEVNHRIPLIDENKVYNYYLPKCADVYKQQFQEKLTKYVESGWWEHKAVPQAAPMLCIPKTRLDP